VHILSKRTLFTAILAATLAACHDSPTAPDTGGSDLQLGLQLVVDVLANPDFLTAPVGDARLFVVERSGRVLIVKNGALLATPFLDIRARVNSIEERGLLSIAFDPQYAANGYFYAYYVNLGGDMAVERFSSTPGSDVAGGSADMVMTIPHGGANPQSGALYIGDVGQDTREEVDVAPATAAGRNFGWRLMEGTACFNPATNCNSGGTLTLPLLEYLHAEGCSVIGGYVYRGSAIPELSGHYLYSDYCQGWLRTFRSVAGGTADRRTWAGVSAPSTVSFGQDAAGELYMIGNGRVSRIVRQ